MIITYSCGLNYFNKGTKFSLKVSSLFGRCQLKSSHFLGRRKQVYIPSTHLPRYSYFSLYQRRKKRQVHLLPKQKNHHIHIKRARWIHYLSCDIILLLELGTTISSFLKKRIKLTKSIYLFYLWTSYGLYQNCLLLHFKRHRLQREKRDMQKEKLEENNIIFYHLKGHWSE